MTDSKPPPFAHTLLQRAFSPDTAASHYNDRILKRPLQILPNDPTPSARATRRAALTARKQSLQKRSKQKPRPLSAAQKRKLGLCEIPKEQQKYAIYEPLNKLWAGYMREVLGLDGDEGRAHVTPSSSGQMLASADMHGALVSVVRSRCVSRVGLEGIVVRDTRFTFEIVTRADVVKAIPKEHTVFRFEIPLLGKDGGDVPKPLVFEIFGEQFQTRAPDRANRKFRMHYQPDI
ncbi:RNase P/MRP, p29 subunit [Dothidotthia symphoricarpi CBS 119687]|uniref:Ribonuclease P protein subunit n=1 Tax=Dothidotthia symphoricarpi CBS 119687 TaxID=1392245 RepID=A0A6A6AEV4_9PLEO|nr:RNase P/MRP, p29 subunit [Dothidotthia symphoricarpi CBS 119687]KAF2129548.1 RNase P/MRP, p29 subunit [Dothidotthia symphoricarpi CBS 119687]